MQLVAGNVMVHRLAWPGEPNTTDPVAPTGRPVSLSVDVVPFVIDAAEAPLTAIEKVVETGLTVSATEFVEVELVNAPSWSVNVAVIGE